MNRITDIISGKRKPRSGNEAKFACWIRTREGRRIFGRFSTFARFIADSGVDRYSADAIMHVMRFDDIFVNGKSHPVNNNHVAYAARLFAERNPKHANLFRRRAVARI